MIYVNDNAKLAELLEKLLTREPKAEDISDAKELIVELKSHKSDVTLMDRNSLTKRCHKYLYDNR